MPVAIYRPFISLGQNIVNQYYSHAFTRIVEELNTLNKDIFQSHGLLQLITDQRSWQQGEHHRILSIEEASDKANRKLSHPAIYIENAGSLSLSKLCDLWLRKPNITLTTETRVHSIENAGDSWILRDTANRNIATGNFVVLANGVNANYFCQQQLLPLTAISGQLSHCSTQIPPAINSPIIEDRGYAVPAVSGYWVGATHHRDSLKTASIKADDIANLATLRKLTNTTGSVTRSWTGVRCATPDRLPVVGGIADSDFYHAAYKDLHHGRKSQTFAPAKHIDGLYVAAGMGSRGATQALYAAELLADLITGTPTADSAIYAAVNPARFLLKKLRRNPKNSIQTKK